MVRYASLFSQLITLFSRQRFYELVFKHGSEGYGKGSTSRDRFVAMLFCQLAQAKSLREMCGGLACCIGKLRHLGLKAAPNKSTFSYANAHRGYTVRPSDLPLIESNNRYIEDMPRKGHRDPPCSAAP